MEQYSKEEAEKMVESMKALSPTGFCPLIRSECRGDCICYIEPRMVNTGWQSTSPSDKWYVYDGHCGNGMFMERHYPQ